MEDRFYMKRAWLKRNFKFLCFLVVLLPFQVFSNFRPGVSSVFQQEREIGGKVLDEDNNPVIGATVLIKGQDNVGAVQTDVDGTFSLDLPDGADVLVISYIGYETQEVVVGDRVDVEIVLAPSGVLDEVVVVGYGQVKKRDLTGSVASVKGEDVAANPVSNVMESLQGRVAGLDIQRTGGQSGEAPSVLLRGRRSISADEEPLYVIDGIPGGNINSLNPNDIESVEVLKDASSTAIYGSEGANGVIIVTTKKAQEGRIQIDVNSYYGINQLAKFPKPLIGDAWIQYQQDKHFATHGSYTDQLSDLNLSNAAITAIENGQWRDWTEETFQTGAQQNHHISVRGGTEKTQGYMSVGIIGEEGIYQNDKLNAYNIRAGADNKFNDYVKAGILTTFNYRDQDRTNSRVNAAYSVYPLGIPYAEDGSVNLYPLPNDDGMVSPIANYARGVLVDNAKNFNLAINPYVEITPLENLSIRSNFGAKLYNTRTGNFASERSYNLATQGSTQKEAMYATDLGYSYIWENIVNYNFDIDDDHEFVLTGVSSWQDNRSESSFIFGTGLDFDEFSFYNIEALENITARSSSFYGTKKLSFAGRLNYSYRGKYLLTVTNRWDGASQLVQRWASFPSAAAAWRISDEQFMESTKGWLDDMKIRAGYGVAGTANVDAYQTQTEVTPGGFYMTLGGSATVPVYVLKGALGNPDITWERAYNANVGLDLSFFNHRLDVAMDYYHTKTKGILYVRTMPSTSGGVDAVTPYTMLSNIADSENRGFELAINSRNIVRDAFTWNTALTFTRASEKLLNIDLGDGLSADDLISEGMFMGHPIGSFYDYKKRGIWQLGEEEEAAKYGAQPGDLKLATNEAFDEDGVSDGGVHPYSPADRMILGKPIPDWTIGMQNNITYKNIDLGVFVTARYGQMINADILGYYNRLSQPAMYDYWTPDNPTNDYPSPIEGDGINTTYRSAMNFVDGSFVKIKNITLGYTLPENIASRAGLSRVRLYGTAYNPLIFSKSHLLRDVDPETGGSDRFPLYRQFVFGVNLSL